MDIIMTMSVTVYMAFIGNVFAFIFGFEALLKLERGKGYRLWIILGAISVVLSAVISYTGLANYVDYESILEMIIHLLIGGIVVYLFNKKCGDRKAAMDSMNNSSEQQ